jgi:hypothetical protein
VGEAKFNFYILGEKIPTTFHYLWYGFTVILLHDVPISSLRSAGGSVGGDVPSVEKALAETRTQ